MQETSLRVSLTHVLTSEDVWNIQNIVKGLMMAVMCHS